MDFYAHGDRARRKTVQLIILFCVALVLIIGAANVVFALIMKHLQVAMFFILAMVVDKPFVPSAIVLHIVFSVFLLTALIVASWRRISALSSSGGDRLADELGGIYVDPRDSKENSHLRRLANVVDEMAIAAGVPRPSIYVLESEPGINALAAGWDYENAVIVISRGALLQLTRDELQGVIAHEMSHIAGGDMRLNIRLIGLLYGLLGLSVVGKRIVVDRGWALQWRFLGIALLAVGSLGVFCGRMIRSGVSRQREFLADAEAVRLTRNPQGLAGALKKIGGFSDGSRMHMARREEVNHMFFASGQSFWKGLMDTHPPLEERIRVIETTFSAADFLASASAMRVENRSAFQNSGVVALHGKGPVGQHARRAPSGLMRYSFIRPSSLDKTPDTLLKASENCEPALLAALALSYRKRQKRQAKLMNADATAVRDITTSVKDLAGEAIYLQVRRLLPKTDALPPEQILPLVEMTLPKLGVFSKGEWPKIIRMVDRLVVMDEAEALSLSAYCLSRMTRLYLTEEKKTAHVVPSAPPPKPTATATQLRQALITLFAVMAASGGKDEEAAARAFDIGIKTLLPKTTPVYQPLADWIAALDGAFELLPTLPEKARKQTLDALVATTGHDGGLRLEEAELLRLVAAYLKLPMPLLTDDERAARESLSRPVIQSPS